MGNSKSYDDFAAFIVYEKDDLKEKKDAVEDYDGQPSWQSAEDEGKTLLFCGVWAGLSQLIIVHECDYTHEYADQAVNIFLMFVDESIDVSSYALWLNMSNIFFFPGELIFYFAIFFSYLYLRDFLCFKLFLLSH